MLKDKACAQSIFALIFERACRDVNETNANVFDELFKLLEQFDAHDDSQRKILLEIGVLVVADLSKDKKNRTHADKFREILFEIIKKITKEKTNFQWIFNTTLPAFVVIVKNSIATNKSSATPGAASEKEIIQLVKLFLKNSVRFFLTILS